jgi:hypothetical protein
MWHLATFVGGPGRLPGGHSRGWLFMKNTIWLWRVARGNRHQQVKADLDGGVTAIAPGIFFCLTRPISFHILPKTKDFTFSGSWVGVR